MTSKKSKCSECSSAADVKPAAEYADLRALLEAWHALDTSGGALLCPTCAAAVCDDLRGETVEILPLDLDALNAPTTNGSGADDARHGSRRKA